MALSPAQFRSGKVDVKQQAKMLAALAKANANCNAATKAYEATLALGEGRKGRPCLFKRAA